MIQISLTKKLITQQQKFQLQVDLAIKQGSIVSLFGPSGSGKTSLLRAIAGLVEPDKGRIVIDNQIWCDRQQQINISPQQRNIGFVFQNYALFPNMTIRDNIKFAMPQKDCEFVEHLLTIAELHHLADQNVQNLSGGQQQRTAVIRALARKPKLLLMDEPFSALDIEMRQRFQEQILNYHKHWRPTIVLVSHNIAEVFRLTNRVIVLDNGAVVNDGCPDQVFGGQNTDNFVISAEVVKVSKQQNSQKVLLLVSNQIVEMNLGLETEISCGQIIKVECNSFQPIAL